MHNRRRFVPIVGQLEPRIQLSTLPIADVSVAYFHNVTTEVVVSGAMTITPSPCNYGSSFVCTLSTAPNPTCNIAGTVWTYIINTSDGTTTVLTPSLTLTATGLTAAINATVPGTYTVTAVTSYTSTNPNSPPGTHHHRVKPVTVPPPTLDASLVPAAGLSATAGSTAMASDSVSTSLGQVNSLAVGTPQELIPGFIPGFPPGQINSFSWSNGVIYDQVAPRLAGFTAAGVGDVFDSWLQQLRIEVPVTGFVGGTGGTFGTYYLYFDLPSVISFTKTSAMTWTVTTN